jgi:hypothetical protein
MRPCERERLTDPDAVLEENVRRPLSIAAERGDLPLIGLLVELGVPLDAGDRTSVGYPPLIAAVQADQVAAVERLLALGAGVDAGDSIRGTGLHHAAVGGQAELAWSAPGPARHRRGPDPPDHRRLRQGHRQDDIRRRGRGVRARRAGRPAALGGRLHGDAVRFQRGPDRHGVRVAELVEDRHGLPPRVAGRGQVAGAPVGVAEPGQRVPFVEAVGEVAAHVAGTPRVAV